MSQLIRNDGVSRPVASQSRQLYELQGYRTNELNSYFEQDALLFPVETIVEKVETKDFDFFLDHGNFFKVVDTLEKFQESQLNLDSAEGRDFLVFKSHLYKIYEIKNRSIHEH